jgi:hypothetical protein
VPFSSAQAGEERLPLFPRELRHVSAEGEEGEELGPETDEFYDSAEHEDMQEHYIRLSAAMAASHAQPRQQPQWQGGVRAAALHPASAVAGKLPITALCLSSRRRFFLCEEMIEEVNSLRGLVRYLRWVPPWAAQALAPTMLVRSWSVGLPTCMHALPLRRGFADKMEQLAGQGWELELDDFAGERSRPGRQRPAAPLPAGTGLDCACRQAHMQHASCVLQGEATHGMALGGAPGTACRG